MKLLRKVGATSQIFQIFIADSSSATGAGLAGLVFNSSSLTAYYHRDTDTTATAISLVTMTVGTFTSSGFKEIDSTNMPGWYQFCPPNAALASGATSVALHLKGAANMAPLPIEVDLDAQVDVTFWNGTVVATPATAGIPDINVKNINNLISSGNAAFGPVWDVVRASHITSGTFGGDTVTPPTNFSAMTISAGGVVEADVTTINTQTVTASGSITFPAATLASTTNITAGTITTATNLTNAPTNGDLTATMKTSVTTAATAATPTAAAVTGNVGGNVAGSVGSVVGAVGSVTGNVGGNVTGSVGSLGATAKTDVSTAVLTTQMTESYAALNAVPTLAQATFEVRAILAEKAISSTTVTTKKIDGSTTAHTYTINSSTAPTSVTTAS